MLNFMRRFTFSVDKLKLMCSGQQPQKFEQIIYLDIVLRSVDQIKLKQKEINLLSSKHFYLIPEYYQVSNYAEVNQELKNTQINDLKQIIEANAVELLKSKQNTLNTFINMVPILGKNDMMKNYLSLIEEQIKALIPNCRDQKECKKFSAISLVRFCKAMAFLLNESDNQSLKQYYQTFVFQILLNKPNIKLVQLFQFLHYLQFVKYHQLVSYLPQKQLAIEVSKLFVNIVKTQINDEKELSTKPEFYSQLAKFLSKTSYFLEKDAEFIENCMKTQIQWKNSQSEFGYLQIILGQVQKVGKGQYCIQRMLELHKNVETIGAHTTYHILTLLYYQARQLMENFKKNPTKANLENLKKSSLETAPLIQKELDYIKSIGLRKLELNQEKINQLKLCQELLKCFHFELLDEEYLNELQFQLQNVASSRKNEVNIDLENFLNQNKVEFISDFSTGLYQYDYYLPKLNMIIECDGSFHFVTGSYDKKDSSTLARNLIILNNNYKLLTINWFLQTESRFQKDKTNYIKQQWDKIINNNDIIYVD